MTLHPREFDQLRSILEEAEEPLTAREIIELLDEDTEIDSSHQVATILGRYAKTDKVDVIREQPYRYRL